MYSLRLEKLVSLYSLTTHYKAPNPMCTNMFSVVVAAVAAASAAAMTCFVVDDDNMSKLVSITIIMFLYVFPTQNFC